MWGCVGTDLSCIVSFVTDERRVVERDEATGPTLSTLMRLRLEDASVDEFVEAGGLSAFRPLTTYYVAEIVDGRPVQSFEGAQLFESFDEAVVEAEGLSMFGRFGVFELVTKAVFG